MTFPSDPESFEVTNEFPPFEHIRNLRERARTFLEAAHSWLGPNHPDLPLNAREWFVFREALRVADAIGRTPDGEWDTVKNSPRGWPHGIRAALVKLCLGFDRLTRGTWGWPIWEPDLHVKLKIELETIGKVEATLQKDRDNLIKYMKNIIEIFTNNISRIRKSLENGDKGPLSSEEFCDLEIKWNDYLHRQENVDTQAQDFEKRPLFEGCPTRIDNGELDLIEQAVDVLMSIEPLASRVQPAIHDVANVLLNNITLSNENNILSAEKERWITVKQAIAYAKRLGIKLDYNKMTQECANNSFANRGAQGGIRAKREVEIGSFSRWLAQKYPQEMDF